MTSASSILPADPGLVGGGEMGALMREKDWTLTPFGPPTTWPQSLRTTVSILLESRFPMVVAWGSDFRFLYNDGYRPILGKTKHPAALGTPCETIFPEVWDVIGPEFERVRRGESFAVDDWLLPLDRNGYLENCWFTLSYSPIRDETGGVGGLLAVVAETTGRVEGERRLDVLRELARRTGDAKSIQQVCEAAALVFGASTLDVPFSLTYLLDPDGRRLRLVASSSVEAASVEAPLEIDLANESTRGWSVGGALRSRRMEVLTDLADRFAPLPGGPHPEPANTAVILPLARPGTPQPYGVLILGVSSRRALDDRYRGFYELAAEHVVAGIANATAYEEERRRAEALMELDRVKTTFFSNVSHEFRTPLTLMLGPVEDILAGARGEIPGIVREDLAAAHRNALRLLRLVNTLLDFTRIEAGRARGVYRPVDLSAITTQLASVFESATLRAGLRLVVDCPPLAEPVYVDAEMWEKIVFNLLSNALKFTFEGEIGITLRREGSVVSLEVRDTGVGIAPDEIAHLFERFHRVHGTRSRSHEGSGIGLALAQDLARLHGGTITVESELGRGSRFTVEIRTGTAHLPSEQIETASASVTSTVTAQMFVEEASRWLPDGASGVAVENETSDMAATATRTRVLAVDDNADMRAYLSRLLRDTYDVELAIDGLDAIERIQRRVPDLVISDIMMPRLDGFGLVDALRAAEHTRGIPVILLSARAGEESTIEGLRAGADDYLVKPFAARELLARVRTHVELSQMRAEMQRQNVETLERERRRLANVFEKAPALIAILRGKEHRFEAANPAYREIVGARDLIGRTVRDALPELEGQGYLDLLDRVFTTGEPHVGFEARMLIRDPATATVNERFINFVYQPIPDVDGRVAGVLTHGVDVTEQVRSRREIDELYRRVTEANASKVHFLAAMSHELRTPLNAILGYADLLRIGVRGDLNDAQQSDLERIQSASRYLLTLINDILNYARIEAGQVDLAIQSVNLRSLIDRTCELIAPRFEKKGLRLECTSPPAEIAVGADEERAQQVLLNLLTNAIKFTDAGGTVALDCSVRADTVEIRVRDTGRGIAPGQQAQVFAPFFQIDPSGTGDPERGVGLGLAISRDLARRMHGDITVESALGSGSTFTLVLPRR